MPKSQPIRTRFAPSSSGTLHVGGARTALLCWAYAKSHGGTFILRIEDTDRKRSSDVDTPAILGDLAWMGITWDEGPAYDGGGGGEHGPYFASQRLDLYHGYIENLLEQGKAYRAFEGREQLEAARASARAEKRAYRYDRAALRLEQATIQRYLDEGRPHVVRFKTPDEQPVTVHDEVYGEVTVRPEEIDDFVILKADGYPTYHFAVVVDDELMDITHVIRGQEHLYNTAKHVLLQDALGFRRPVYAHLSLIFNPDGSRMSKRDKAKVARSAAKDHLSSKTSEDRTAWLAHLEWLDRQPTTELPHSKRRHRRLFQQVDHFFTRTEIDDFIHRKNDEAGIAELIADDLGVDLPEIDIQDFRLSGYLPDVLVNYLALLGWSPGGDIEKFDQQFLIEHFDLDRVIKSPARFDRDKLLAFNLDALQAMSTEQFTAQLREHDEGYERGYGQQLSKEQFAMFAATNHQRSKTLDDPFRSCRFLIMTDDEIVYERSKAVRKALESGEPNGYAHLEAMMPLLKGLPEWTVESLEPLLKRYADDHAHGKLGRVAQPLRIAVSGGVVSPAIFQTLAILGRQAVVNRIERCLGSRELSSSA